MAHRGLDDSAHAHSAPGVVCDGTALSPDFVIASGTRGSVSHSFDGIPAGSVCTISEPADGATATITATVEGDGDKVTVPAGKVVPVNVMDVYRAAPGSLKVTKTIAGAAAHQHSDIEILVACGGPLKTFDFIIPAHTGAGSVSRHFDNLVAGSRCTVTETAAGGNSTVDVVALGKHKAIIRPNRTATAHLTDIFTTTAPVTG